MKGKIKDRTGVRFGDNCYVESYHGVKHGCSTWNCLCKCGSPWVVRGSDIKNKIRCPPCSIKLRSINQKTHGDHKSRLNSIWRAMKNRCNPNSSSIKNKKNYSDKGIYVCKEWMKYVDFKKWSLDNGYEEHLTIERKCSMSPYCPENCIWADYGTQSENTSRSRWWIIDGKRFSSAKRAGIHYNVNYRTITQWCKGYSSRGINYPPKPNCSTEMKYD